MNEASRAQINAAAPATSVWLSANAGIDWSLLGGDAHGRYFQYRVIC